MNTKLSERLSNLRVVLEAINAVPGETDGKNSVSKDDKRKLLLQMRCDECGTEFEMPQAMQDEGEGGIVCPECGSEEVRVIEK